MAIAKMKHISIFSLKSQKELILSGLQEYGGVEIVELDSPLLSSAPTVDKPDKIEKAIAILDSYRPKSSIKDLRTPKLSLSAQELEEKVRGNNWESVADQVIQTDQHLKSVRQQRGALAEQLQQTLPWADFSLCEKDKEGSPLYTFLTITIPVEHRDLFVDKSEELFGDDFYVETVFDHNFLCGLFLSFPQNKLGQLSSLLPSYNASVFDLPKKGTVAESLAMLSLKEAELTQQEEDTLESFRTLAKELPPLEQADDYYTNMVLRQEQADALLESTYSLGIEGWIPEKQQEPFSSYINTVVPDGTLFIDYADVSSEEDVEQVPVLLYNNRLVKTFENLTEMYSLPAYNEIDPTPLLTIFYMIFFGMMAADLGYGLVMFLLLGSVRIIFRKNKEMVHKTSFFFALSFPVMAWGLIFGSFFGMDLPFQLIAATSDIIPLLIISLIFGWVQIVCGLVINVYLNTKRKDIFATLSDGVCWLCLMVGVALMVLSQFIFKTPILFYAGIGLCVVAALLIVVVPIIQNKSKGKGLAKGLYALYGATSYISDIVSYTRLMALAVAGASIGLAFNTILSFLPVVARFSIGWILAIALHLFNMFLSLLGAYVHSLRLQLVEFFGKFYNGGGRKFAPFKSCDNNVIIQQKTKK